MIFSPSTKDARPARILHQERTAFVLFFLLISIACALGAATDLLLMMLIGGLFFAVLIAGVVLEMMLLISGDIFEHRGAWRRARVGLAVPAALFLATLGGGVAFNTGLKLSAKAHLALGEGRLRAQGSQGFQVLDFKQGIPDGGIAIIRSPGPRPETLDQEEMVALTGERIKRCERLGGHDYYCGYD